MKHPKQRRTGTASPLKSLEAVIEGEFIGMATVGDKGQIVLPVEARRELGINPGEKLMVYLRTDRGQVRLAKAEFVTELMRHALGEFESLQRMMANNGKAAAQRPKRKASS